MQKQVSPAIAAIVIVIIVAIVGFFLWRGVNSGGGSLPPGAPGNLNPLSKGGSAEGQGAGAAQPAAGKGAGGGPFHKAQGGG